MKTRRATKNSAAAAWFRRGIGRYAAAEKRRACKKMLRDLPGLAGAQLCGGEMRPLFAASMVRLTILVGRKFADDNADGGGKKYSAKKSGKEQPAILRADWRELPFAEDSLDLLILDHALEASENPHAVLREAARVLRPQGTLLVVGFNPWSLLAAARGAPWRRRWLSVARVKDWLALLNLAPAGGVYAAFLPPFGRRRWVAWMEAAGRRWWPLAGGLFFLQAEKRRPDVRLLPSPFARLKKPALGLAAEKRIQ